MPRAKRTQTTRWCTCEYCAFGGFPGQTVTYETWRGHQRRAAHEEASRKWEIRHAELMAEIARDEELKLAEAAQRDVALASTPTVPDMQAESSGQLDDQLESAPDHTCDGGDVPHASEDLDAPFISDEDEDLDAPFISDEDEAYIPQPFRNSDHEADVVEEAVDAAVIDHWNPLSNDDDTESEDDMNTDSKKRLSDRVQRLTAFGASTRICE